MTPINLYSPFNKSLLRGSFVFLTFALSVILIGCSTNNTSTDQVTQFQKNDVVVFIGDSITHGGSYHKNVFLYYATRFPHQDFVYYNAGVSGDTAVGTVDRFETDIAIHKPTTATIMLGMNDVSLDLYRNIPTDKAGIHKRNNTIEKTKMRYIAHMEKLIVALQNINTKVILIKPSIYDQTADIETENKFGANDQLVVYGNEVAKLADKYGLPLVDFQTPLLAINQQLQSNDKTASIIGKDRVHPGEQGHLVMSHAFLKAQGLPALVTGFSIDVKRKNHEIDNCQLHGDVNISGDNVNFSCTAGALPFPMNEAQTSALALVPFQQDLNQQILRISNLSVGSYKLLIDKKEVGQYSHTLLSKGVNLSDNSNTPMYQQALVVKSLNDKRAQLSGKLRGIALIRYSMLSKYPDLDMNSKTHVSDTLYAHVEKSAGKPWYGYLKSQVKEYLKNVEQKQLIQSEINVLFKKIAIENNPKQHYWEIIKM